MPTYRPQGGAAERRQARGGQRGARGRLPGRPDRRTITARARRVDGEVRSIAVLELELDKQVEPAAGGHDASPCARARRSASSTWSSCPAASDRTASRPGTRSRWPTRPAQTGTSRTCSRPSRPRRATTPARPAGLRRRAGRPRAGDQPGDRGAAPLPGTARAGDARLSAPRHGAARLFPALARDGGRRRRRWRRSRLTGSRPWRTPSPRSASDPRGPPGDDRGEPADAGRRDRLVPGPDAVPGPLRGPLAPAPARRRGARRALPPLNAALAAGVPAFRQTPALGERPGAASSAPSRTSATTR